jgi:cyclase
MIAGAGCNITVQTGPDGAVLVDSGSGTESAEVAAEVKKLTDQPIRYIIDTDADPNHVGGNESLAKLGRSIYAAVRAAFHFEISNRRCAAREP